MHSTELPTYQIDFNETLLLRYVYIRCAVRTRVARPYPLLRNTAEEKAFVPVRPTLITRRVNVIIHTRKFFNSEVGARVKRGVTEHG